MSFTDATRRSVASLGESRWFRIAVAAILTAVIGAAALVTYRESSRILDMRKGVRELLSIVDRSKGDLAAKQLFEQGTLDYQGVVLGDKAFAPVFQRLFNEQGKLEQSWNAADLLVIGQIPEWMPTALLNEPLLTLVLGLLAIAVVNFACFSGLAVPLVGVTVASAVLGGGALWAGKAELAASLAAIPAFVFAFALLIQVLLFLLGISSPVFAVASAVIREAMRLRIAVGFAAVAIVVIPLIPHWIDETSQLRYQVQTYLSSSLDIMYLVCAFLTIFFGCATVAFEIRDRQAWTTLTKPVSRLSWLTGKWLGLVVLNAAILGVCTLAMVSFLAQVRSRPPMDPIDGAAAHDEVLVARSGGRPVYNELAVDEVKLRVTEIIRADPNFRADIEEGRRTEIEVQRTLARAVREEHMQLQRIVPPGTEQVYLFEGLGYAREAKANLSLRYKFYAGASDPHALYPVIFFLGPEGDETWVDRQFVAAQTNVISVPADKISPDGTLRIRVANLRYDPNAPGGQEMFFPGGASIMFDPDGLELMYKVGDFGPNLLRAQLVNLLKLSFVAMIAVTLSSFLSFPVACLVVFTVFASGSIAPYLATSIDEYRIRTESGALKMVEAVIRSIASAVEFSVRAFGEARANGPLVEGRLVPWSMVAWTFLLIGVAWSGVMLVLGFAVFRRKELAIYSGQGG